jgi:ATP/maltotriose-dependent transcriptional regulator MalT
VLHLLAAGHTNSEIGQALFLALGTVKKHTHNIYTKLGVANRTRAVQAARERGLILEAALPTAE